MQEVIMMKGLPGSGKTTWAREYMKENTWVRRVCKDDIRAMIGGEYCGPNEDAVIAIRNKVIDLLLNEGYWVIVDDTNLNNRHLVAIQNLCSKHGAKLRWEVLHTPLEVCIERDAQRPTPVGEKRIREMDEQWNGAQLTDAEMEQLRRVL
jgi:predicted kinase